MGYANPGLYQLAFEHLTVSRYSRRSRSNLDGMYKSGRVIMDFFWNNPFYNWLLGTISQEIMGFIGCIHHNVLITSCTDVGL